MKWLTQQEQIVLAILAGLFIVGLTVKVWRQSDAPAAVEDVSEH